MRKLRVVFITPEEPSVLPLFFARVLPAVREEAVGIAVVSPIYKNSTWLTQARRFITAFGVKEFLIEAVLFAYRKLADTVGRVLPVRRFYSVKRLARAHRIPLLEPESVNAPEFLDRLRELAPDLIISVSCPQIFRQPLLDLPPLGCINIHSSLLPYYRGMLPTFWVLANGERETGVTVHYMNEAIDGGGIILQRTVPIEASESLHTLMKKCKLMAADMIVEVLEQFRDGTVSTIPNPANEGNYFSFPTRADVVRFKSLGKQLR